MTQAVHCSNRDCPTLRHKGEPRYIGERTAGGGGRWQCSACGRWTSIFRAALVDTATIA